MTNAELIAWNLGVELARNPGLRLQGPNEDWDMGMVAMSDERLSAMAALTPDVFFAWVERAFSRSTRASEQR